MFFVCVPSVGEGGVGGFYFIFSVRDFNFLIIRDPKNSRKILSRKILKNLGKKGTQHNTQPASPHWGRTDVRCTVPSPCGDAASLHQQLFTISWSLLLSPTGAPGHQWLIRGSTPTRFSSIICLYQWTCREKRLFNSC